MVKLFVGGLPDGVDSMRLRQLFSQFVIVNECDVIKDYAFVHVADEESARVAIEKLDGYILEGKSINIRRSTSKLRKEPGMDKRCFRCGAADHKTPQCPNDPSNSLKRANSSTLTTLVGGPDAKRFSSDAISTAGVQTIKIDLTGRNGESSSAQTSHLGGAVPSYAYAQQSQQQIVVQQPPVQMAPISLAEADPELPRPIDSDLIPLYEQYIESRTRYFYFRERFSKEVKVRSQLMPQPNVAPLQAPYASGLYAAQPQQQQQYVQQAPAGAASYTNSPHFYANTAGVSAPYAAVQQQQQQQQPQTRPY